MAFRKTKGSVQIVVGLIILGLLVAMAITEPFYKTHRMKLIRQLPHYEKLDYIHLPPSIRPFSWLFPLATKRGDREIDLLGEVQLERSKYPSPNDLFPLGTTHDGNDLLGLILEGSSTLLFSGVLATIITLITGLAGGIVIGMNRGTLLRISQFPVSVLISFPPLLLLLLVVSALGFGPSALMVAIGVVNAPKVIDVIAKKIKHLRNQEFILALYDAGLPFYTILGKYMLWNNCRRMLLVNAIYAFLAAVMLEISLSFLGFGILDRVSFGRLINRDIWSYVMQGYYWEFFFPLCMLIALLLGICILADGLGKRMTIKEQP
ncbi:MAG: ABC transporter permease subunit [bacterium]